MTSAYTHPPSEKLDKRELTVAIIGNPNTGKSTLFNALSGMQSRVGNYPGVTVEKKLGRVKWQGQSVTLVDLPGTYSLSPRTPDEMVAVDVLLGRQRDIGAPDVVICIVDAANLERNLYLYSQILDMRLPTVLVLNMIDVAESRGLKIDIAGLQQRLGVPVVATQAHRRRGLDQIAEVAMRAAQQPLPVAVDVFPTAFSAEIENLTRQLAANGEVPPRYLVERMVLDEGGQVEREFAERNEGDLRAVLSAVRTRLRQQAIRIPAVEALSRYAWARQTLQGLVTQDAQPPSEHFSDRLDRLLTHRVAGLLIFCLLMFVVFQSIYAWAEPLMAQIENLQGWVAELVTGVIAPGPLRSLLVDGVIAGVGGVLVFLPQIALLFLFIAIFEDCGYMARAAFLMDKLMTRVGLSGKSFVPLMSSFACAIPGIMATRVIENRRDRMVTMLVAPLMSCSARLPVYLLLIGAFVPAVSYAYGLITLQGLALFAMTSLGAVIAIPVAWILKKTYFRGETPPFVMELPSYKWPSPIVVLGRVYDRAKAFVVRAGTLIFATSILVWAAGYFPGDHTQLDQITKRIEEIQPQLTALDAQPQQLDRSPQPESAEQLAQVAAQQAELSAELESLELQQKRLGAELISGSVLGRLGKAIEPVVEPLGWDWRIGVGVIASFPAREVIIATLGTVYSLGGDVDEQDEGLVATLRNARWPDGRPVYNLPVAVSLMVFFALCAQCASTLVIMRRETNSWYWPAFTFFYMTLLAYVGALLAYQVGMRLI